MPSQCQINSKKQVAALYPAQASPGSDIYTSLSLHRNHFQRQSRTFNLQSFSIKSSYSKSTNLSRSPFSLPTTTLPE